MDLIVGLAALAGAIALLAFIASPRTGRALDMFAAGFLPYRGPEWPQGVQEEEPVPWSWSSTARSDPSEASQACLGAGPEEAEVIEIGRDVGPAARAVHRGPMVRGMATRPR